jgi:hypothetical protein
VLLSRVGFWLYPEKLHYSGKRPVSYKHSSLFRVFINYGRKKRSNIDTMSQINFPQRREKRIKKTSCRENEFCCLHFYSSEKKLNF